jgi:hypothetical protein
VTSAISDQLYAVLAHRIIDFEPAAPDYRREFVVDTFYSSMNARIERERDAGGLFFSFDRILDHRPELFYDEVHTWDEAHEVHAERILALLIANELL